MFLHNQPAKIMYERAIICFQSPFASLTRQTIAVASIPQVKGMLLRSKEAFAFSATADQVQRLRQYANHLGYSDIVFTGPLDPIEGETLVIYPGTTRIQFAVV